MVDVVSWFAENHKCWRKHKTYLPKSTKELLTRWWECRAQIQSILEPREKPEVQLLLPWSHLLRGNFLGLGVKGWNLLTAKDGVLVKPRSVWSPRRQHTAGRSSDSSAPPYQLVAREAQASAPGCYGYRAGADVQRTCTTGKPRIKLQVVSSGTQVRYKYPCVNYENGTITETTTHRRLVRTHALNPTKSMPAKTHLPQDLNNMQSLTRFKISRT